MREANQLPQPSVVDIDPEDPTQILDEAGRFNEVDLGAQPHAEADAELDAAVASSAGEYESADATDSRDVGELYGIHMPAAADPDLDVTADGETFEDAELGENMFETLEKKMAEGGPKPEAELDVEDDSDAERGHARTDRRDRPVADKGSGGLGGQ